jgi:small subunit ribosomal protein S6
MAIYETIFILDSLMQTKEIDAAIERFSEILKSNGCKIRKEERMGKRRLAYEIQKKQYGYYGSIEFEGEGDVVSELENEYNFNDKVLRYLTYRYDKSKLKMMAKAKEEAPAAEEKAEKPAAEQVAEPVVEKAEEPQAENSENTAAETEVKIEE